jgi:hypothetical protein
MAIRKGHKAESDVEPDVHQARSRAAKNENEDEGTYVGMTHSDDRFDAGETGAEARSKDF